MQNTVFSRTREEKQVIYKFLTQGEQEKTINCNHLSLTLQQPIWIEILIQDTSLAWKTGNTVCTDLSVDITVRSPADKNNLIEKEGWIFVVIVIYFQ